MNVAMMQPTFMPWQGFFELIGKADVFILLDDFQFSVKSWHQRNRLFAGRGKADWYTMPVDKKASFKAPLNAARINESVPWRENLWRRIRFTYARAPYFSALGPWVEAWLHRRHDSVADQNISLILWVAELLSIRPEIRYSSRLAGKSTRSEGVADLLRWCGATRYYSARGSFGYMREDGVFPVTDIEALFQDFVPRPYPQAANPAGFVPNLSVLDALFNVGPEKTAELVKKGTRRWLSWDEMTKGGPIGYSGAAE